MNSRAMSCKYLGFKSVSQKRTSYIESQGLERAYHVIPFWYSELIFLKLGQKLTLAVRILFEIFKIFMTLS